MLAETFLQSMLTVMEHKHHWAWPFFTSGQVAKEKLHIHLEQEYAVFVCDFPVLVGRAYIQCPIAAARRELAENLYEEETGGLHAGRPHPELFLEYPRGLGFDLTRFENVELLAGAKHYRQTIDRLTLASGWAVAAAIVTVWIEGTPYERSLFDADALKPPVPPLEDHPLVKHYGLSVAHLALTKAHRGVEGEHRLAAWRMMIDHVAPEDRSRVVDAMGEARDAWLTYRDDIARACGLTKP